VDVGETWPELVGGHRRIVDAFHTADRCFLLLEARLPERGPRPLDQKALQILERLLNGDGVKVIAVDLGVAESYVSTVFRQSAERLGLRFRVSNMPTLLMMAAHAMRSRVRVEGRRVSLVRNDVSLVALSAARPDQALADKVSAAEYAVARLLVEGHRHSEIAALRGTSVRTVANQIGSVFRKLDVSGRSELLTRLFLTTSHGKSHRTASSSCLGIPQPVVHSTFDSQASRHMPAEQI
jgi:DNA-binding NarL/FixJ family response regulator